MNKFKSGYVSIIGRPNVGKSTLLNSIIGQKIVIATDKAQTTRRRIKGIFTNDKAQIVFLDTPGVHKPLDKLGEFLLDEAKFAIPDTDVVLFVVDASEKAGLGDKWIAQNLLDIKKPIILVLNKVDLVKNPQKKEEILLSYKLLFKENLATVKISAKTGRNIDTLISNIIRKLPKGEMIYPDDEVTDETMRSIAKEVIREKILENTQDEIPHSVAVVIDTYKEEDSIDNILATIYVETESQKGIMIGKGATMLKKISTEARCELENIAEKKIFLNIQVKVKKKWRKNKQLVENWVNN